MCGTCCNEIDGLLQKSAKRGQHVGVLYSTRSLQMLHSVLETGNP